MNPRAIKEAHVKRIGLLLAVVVMFAAGVAHLAWMGVLALVMLVEKAAPGGDRLVVPVGVALGAMGVLALVVPHAIPGL